MTDSAANSLGTQSNTLISGEGNRVRAQAIVAELRQLGTELWAVPGTRELLAFGPTLDPVTSRRLRADFEAHLDEILELLQQESRGDVGERGQ